MERKGGRGEGALTDISPPMSQATLQQMLRLPCDGQLFIWGEVGAERSTGNSWPVNTSTTGPGNLETHYRVNLEFWEYDPDKTLKITALGLAQQVSGCAHPPRLQKMQFHSGTTGRQHRPMILTLVPRGVEKGLEKERNVRRNG